ncbi:MAG: DUF393 domain-containing protein [Acidimicrobiia bacterium]|nr:DCC1-like thiol-disulfide oxidoreductase family protein [bacterium]MXX63588.1 DUF393 domain-containing protein [Acidimicrobiia bacterium]MXZ07453.1 DUF393 domain-containing protein [Acidimicrobiia bacterium]MYD04337.1 DUF393 domain-containing protein [Acidimicrobiia bacterium]MYH55790.1 DUF393 domain-containing protein [Acidimicrobiia bacterium]
MSRPQVPTVTAWLVYDGECPLCSNYTRFLSLKESGIDLVPVDARTGGPLVDEIRQLPHNLDEGMVLKLDSQFYIGHQALGVLALLSDQSSLLAKLNHRLFGSPKAARLGYPLLRAARRIILAVKRIPPLT